jgi:anti-anti-sigma factor
VIIDAVVFGMIDVGELRRLQRVARFDFWVAVAAIAGVLSLGVLGGILIGVALSLIWLVYVSTRPAMPLLGRERDTGVFSELQDGHETFPGITILRLDGGLFFATAEALEERVRELLDAGQPQRALVLDLKAVNFVDAQGAAKLGELQQLLDARGITLWLAGVHPQVQALLDADGLRVRIDGNVRTAVAEALAD